jgi:hypothetical protein
MKTYVFTIAAVILVFTTLCLSPLWCRAQATGPESVVRGIIAALNTGDIDRALTFVGDETVIVIIPQPGELSGRFKGKEEIRVWWEFVAAIHGHSEFRELRIVDETTAVWTATFAADPYEAMGMVPVYHGTAIVQNGLLKTWSWSMTDETLEQRAAYYREQQTNVGEGK